MKIQCSVCGTAEAAVLCCADEAALCGGCDEKVHAANKLAGKHQRTPLSNSSSQSQMPKCDICQDAAGYFFCLEDRALLCRKCDVAIHTVNNYVTVHQRFLLTGVKIGLEASEPGPSSSSDKSHSGENIVRADAHLLANKNVHLSGTGQYNKVTPSQVFKDGDFASPKLSFAGGSSSESIQQWELDEFLELTDFNQNCAYMDNGSSKADSGKLGDLYGSPNAEFELDNEEHFGEVPDSSWAVPKIPSPPTASGLHWPKTHHGQVDNADFVPDVLGE